MAKMRYVRAAQGYIRDRRGIKRKSGYISKKSSRGYRYQVKYTRLASGKKLIYVRYRKGGKTVNKVYTVKKRR